MGLEYFFQKWKAAYEKRGLSIAPEVIGDFAASSVSKIPGVNQFGTNVYDLEWDYLVVLDGCRYDLYTETVGESGAIWSVGSTSPEWMANNFAPKYRTELKNTAYITGNVFSRECSGFGYLDEVWRYEWNDELGTIEPQKLTDRAIDLAQRRNFDRTIIHYMQPHYPFIGGGFQIGHIEVEGFGNEDHINENNIWSQLMFGVRDDVDRIWEAYRKNLEYVFENVELLLENVEGTVAISSDHGNSFGEWGNWGHRPGIQIPELRRVPWDVRECSDEKTYSPKVGRQSAGSRATVQDRLESLGYR